MKNKFLYTLSLHVISTLLPVLFRCWFATCRVQNHGLENRKKVVKKSGIGVAVFWHYSFLFSFYYNRNKKAVAMVSASKDGEYISRFLNAFGIETVRGSRNRGGVGALKGMIRAMKKGYNGAIVADGSQGPARVLQAGSIVLASRVGVPVFPMGWSCNRYIRINSWDGTAIPYPFSKVEFFQGEPLVVPPKIKAEEIEEYRLVLESRLNELYDNAWKLQGKTAH